MVNGVSDLLVEVFGDSGRHARSAVGMVQLPGSIPVEVELLSKSMVMRAKASEKTEFFRKLGFFANEPIKQVVGLNGNQEQQQTSELDCGP